MCCNINWMSFIKPFIGSLLVSLLFLPVSVFSQISIQEEIEVLKSSLKDKKDGDKVLLLKDIAMKYRSIDYDSAWMYADMAYTEADALENEFLKGRILITYGILENGKGNSYGALKYYERALPAIEDSNDHYSIGALYTNISNAYEKVGEVDQSVEFQLKALEQFTISKDTIWIAGSYNNLGSRYQAINEWELSLEYFEKASELYKKMGNSYYEALIYNNLASVYLYFEDYEKVIEYALLSQKIYESIGASFESAYSMYNLGYGYRGLNKLEEAKSYFTQALNIQIEKGDQNTAIHLQNDIAVTLLLQKEYGQAREVALEAYMKAKEINLLTGQEVLSKTLSMIYEAENNYQKAFEFLKSNSIVKDSLFITEKAKEVLNLKEKYESEQKENEILRQKNELVANELTLKNRNNLLMMGGGLVVLIMVIGFVLFRDQRLKAEAQEREAALQRAMVEAQAQESLKEQRVRIARDLHDNIGSQLTYITSIIESAKKGIDQGEAYITGKLVQMGQFAVVTISELRDTIWAMNKDEISLMDIQERTKELAAMVHEATDDRISVRIESELSDIVFNSFTGMNLFRIIQECINNAVKHSETNEIQVQFDELKDAVQVRILDKGRGFDIRGESLGNGLRIMKTRAEKSGIALTLESTVGQGTKIKLVLAKP